MIIISVHTGIQTTFKLENPTKSKHCTFYIIGKLQNIKQRQVGMPQLNYQKYCLA